MFVKFFYMQIEPNMVDSPFIYLSVVKRLKDIQMLSWHCFIPEKNKNNWPSYISTMMLEHAGKIK